MDKWDARFMELAGVIANWASCYKADRKIGAVIVKNKRIVTTGYNGAPSGIKTCVERGECLRQKLGIASGTRAELCYAVHAEQNAIIQAARLGSSIDGATLYCTHPLRAVREDDRQFRHPPGGVSGGIPRRLRPGNAERGRRRAGALSAGAELIHEKKTGLPVFFSWVYHASPSLAFASVQHSGQRVRPAARALTNMPWVAPVMPEQVA